MIEKIKDKIIYIELLEYCDNLNNISFEQKECDLINSILNEGFKVVVFDKDNFNRWLLVKSTNCYFSLQPIAKI